MSTFWDNFFLVLGIAVVAAFILVGGHMIGESVAHSNQVEHSRQLDCMNAGGHIEYVTNLGEICRK